MSQLFVRTGIHFSSNQQALEHIGAEMLARGVVHDSYPAALLEREATFPTGIATEACCRYPALRSDPREITGHLPDTSGHAGLFSAR